MPVWTELTKKELPKPNEGQAMAEDTVLKAQKKQVDEKLKAANARIKELLESLKEAESIRHGLQKDLHKVTTDRKFEKIAADGIAKKAQIHEYENNTLKGERKTLLEEAVINRKRVKELELALNDTRAKYLKSIHEVELLQRDVREKVASAERAERQAVEANKSLIDKLQKLSTLQSINDSQKRVIDAQGGEMVDMTAELTVAKEETKALQSTIVRQEATIATQSMDTDLLERQVSKLRGTVMDLAVTTSEKSQAYDFSSTFGETNGAYRAGSNNGRSRAATLDARLRPPGSAASASSPLTIAVPGAGVSSRTLPSIRHSPTEGVTTEASLSRRPATHAGMGPIGGVLSPIASPFGNHRKTPSFDMNVLAMDRISTAHSATSQGGGGDGSSNFFPEAPVLHGHSPVPGGATAAAGVMPPPEQRELKHAQSEPHMTAAYGGGGTMDVAELSGTAPAVSGGPSLSSSADESRDMGDIQAELELRAKLETEERRRRDILAVQRMNAQRKQEAFTRQKKASGALSGRNKTRFVGQGLGMTQSAEGSFNPSGSAKSVLKKIMADFEAKGL